MSLKNSNTTSDYIEWEKAVNLVHRLYNDGNYRMSLLIGCGIFFGLHISDLLQLTWAMLLDGSSFEIVEKKTAKHREVRINANFQKHIRDCYKKLGILNKQERCFISHRNRVYTIQRINVLLKEIKAKYNIKVEHLSTHSLRKTFGRKVVENAGENSEMALIKLSEIFNHASPMITRRYLGLRAEELEEVYNVLEF